MYVIRVYVPGHEHWPQLRVAISKSSHPCPYNVKTFPFRILRCIERVHFEEARFNDPQGYRFITTIQAIPPNFTGELH